MEEIEQIAVIYVTHGQKTTKNEPVIREAPFTIIFNDKELATLQCTPSGLVYLAVGFLLSQGLLKQKEDIQQMVVNEEGIRVDAKVTSLEMEFLTPRRLIGSASASVIPSYQAMDAQDMATVDSDVQVYRSTLFRLMKEFEQRSSLYKETRGNHSCALYNTEGAIEAFAEDIGRHNAVDKVFGECLLRDIPTGDKILVTSGRISSEILIKVAKRKTPFIVSLGAPTSLSISLAKNLGVTVISFVRGEGLAVYTGSQRVI